MQPVYLPIEIKRREYSARLRTAAHLLKMGVPVVIGQQWGIFDNCKNLSPGVILFKTANAIQGGLMKAFKKAGHTVVALDEECLCATNASAFQDGVTPIAAENCDLFLAQSAAHKEAVQAKYPLEIEVVGSPRVDASEFKQYIEAADILRKEIGPFILFNTNYGCINSIWGDDFLKKICIRAGVDMATFQPVQEWEHSNRAELEALITWTAETLPRKVVVRVHPAENPSHWRPWNGADVRVDTHPHPWTLAADVMVHTRCTTGLEAALMGARALNIEPTPHPAYQTVLNKINPTVKGWKQGAAVLKEWVDHGTGRLAAKPDATILENHLPTGDSSKKIAERLCEKLERVDTMTFKGFRKGNRPAILREKCSIGVEFTKDLTTAVKAIGLKHPPRCAQLDESLFFIMP